MDNKGVGRKGERLAVQYLQSHGYGVLATNYRCPLGEIDIIASKQDLVVFVEVKTRQSFRFGRPAAAVTGHKQQHIVRTAQWYIKNNSQGISTSHYRFDVIEVFSSPAGQSTINHLQGAFEAQG